MHPRHSDPSIALNSLYTPRPWIGGHIHRCGYASCSRQTALLLFRAFRVANVYQVERTNPTIIQQFCRRNFFFPFLFLVLLSFNHSHPLQFLSLQHSFSYQYFFTTSFPVALVFPNPRITLFHFYPFLFPSRSAPVAVLLWAASAVEGSAGNLL